MPTPCLTARRTFPAALAVLLAFAISTPHVQAEDKEIDFSKYDKEMLLLVIDQMQKRIKSLERENALLREKLGTSDPRAQRRSASSPSGTGQAGSASSAAPVADREVGKRGQRTEALQKFNYDGESGRTYVGTGDRLVHQGTRHKVQLGMSSSFDGKTPPSEIPPITMTLTVAAAHRDHTTHNSQTEMAIILDGEKTDVGFDHYQHWYVGSVREEERHNESLITFLKPEMLEKMAQARSVVIKTVPRAYELDKDMKQAIRDLHDFYAGR